MRVISPLPTWIDAIVGLDPSPAARVGTIRGAAIQSEPVEIQPGPAPGVSGISLTAVQPESGWGDYGHDPRPVRVRVSLHAFDPNLSSGGEPVRGGGSNHDGRRVGGVCDNSAWDWDVVDQP